MYDIERDSVRVIDGPTKAPIRALIAVPQPSIRVPIAGILQSSGYEVEQCDDLTRLLSLTDSHAPPVALIALSLLREDAAASAEFRTRHGTTAIVGVGRGTDADAISSVSTPGIAAVVLTPVAPVALLNTVRLARQRHHELQQCREVVTLLRSQLETTKTMSRAVGILMRRTGTTEYGGRELIEQAASRAGVSPIDIARDVVLSEPRRQPFTVANSTIGDARSDCSVTQS
jgi:two-component system, response regulator PdtaR